MMASHHSPFISASRPLQLAFPRRPEEVLAAELLLAVSPAARPSGRPRSGSLQALCDVALNDPALLNGPNAAPSLALSPTAAASSAAPSFFSKAASEKPDQPQQPLGTILGLLKRSAVPTAPATIETENKRIRRARSASESSASSSSSNGEKRIGAYTLEERREKIERFLDKRTRRVWFKKVRYACRKDLAQCRTRVKGRFVSSKVINEQVEAA